MDSESRRPAEGASLRSEVVAFLDGYAEASCQSFEIKILGRHSVLVDVLWRIERARAAEPQRFHTAYNLVRQEEGWRVLLCTAYEEARPTRSRAPRL